MQTLKTLFLSLSLFCLTNIEAQTLSGMVQTEDLQPLEGVSVFNQTTGAHTHTDRNGSFGQLKAAVNDILSFSYLGYESIQKTITDIELKEGLNVTMNYSPIALEQITISPKQNVLNNILLVDLETSPVKSSQELLRKIPGIFIGQHAGGGKAEQIFLRGFDIDHGTDINLSVDGLPVNMVSHAHGQGYSDLHFIIPETIDKIDFGKGPYNAERGDFTTAGFVAFNTKERLNGSSIAVEYGDFDSFRTVVLLDLFKDEKQSAYMAASMNTFNGPFDSPQNFNRFNLFGKYRFQVSADQSLKLTVSHFQSKWDASGQIPQRAVDQGLISRFGAIDATEGGNTSRSNIILSHGKILNNNNKLKSTIFFSNYDFDLYSNFTFFLEDPVNGDQIRQTEDRNLMGFETVYSGESNLFGTTLNYRAGLGLRYDDVDEIALSHTKNRRDILERLAYGNIDQINTNAFLDVSIEKGKFKLLPAIRFDYFKFDYEDILSSSYSNSSKTKLLVSPKLKLWFTPSNDWQLFFKSGLGFHSNDARVVVSPEGNETLPRAFGMDVGGIKKIAGNFILNGAIWMLLLEQEFVYVGDAGIVEPGGRTRRMGLDLGFRYSIFEQLYLSSDLTYTYARSTDEPEGQDYIPLAPEFTATAGITYQGSGIISGGINVRYIGDRPANEDFSLTAKGYFVTDANVNISLGSITFSLIAENLFNTEWNETQFATRSRLKNEASAVEEIHFTPGTPFFVRGKIKVNI